ncbi:MAG TPA: phenylalanine--tRNA ligase subunit beta [Tepidisphaeraceae bacterium]|nr:phenylalanine--tRNA ligase subunit beta [Tepidisphaeraceae bacterium]
MKVSLEWLGDFVTGRLDASALAEALTHGGFPVESIEMHGNDPVLDVEVTSNRGDCLSHIGVAREVAAVLNLVGKEVKYEATESAIPIAQVTSVAIEAERLCPHYTARVIRGVKIKPSPEWMQRRLMAVGVRPINNVVDVTNYVMFEMGQPLHAFDFDKLSGGRIIVRTARAGESIVSIDGHERKLSAEMLVIADASKPVALAGVMGGRDSEVGDATVTVLLESARFDPLSVRSTARKLAMKSDGSYRFERGIDPTLPLRASLRTAQLILETAGGELFAGIAQDGTEMSPPRNLVLRPQRLKELLGVEISLVSCVDSLNRLGLKPTVHEGQIHVAVPSWRADLNIEADLIEEVARLVGYDKIPIRDELAIRLTPPEPRLKTINSMRSNLVAGGYFEAVTVTFVSDQLAEDFKTSDARLPRTDAMVRKVDAQLRPSMLPGLLEVIRRNEFAGNADAKFFEIGSTFILDSAGKVVEKRRLAIVGGADVRDVRGMIELILNRIDSSRSIEISPAEARGFARGGCGQVKWGKDVIGHLGKIDRSIADKLDLRSAPVAAEIELEPLLADSGHVPTLAPLPRFPAVRRDLSLIMPDNVPFESVHQLIRENWPVELEAMEYVGSYRGKPLEKGTKSQTISLVFRDATQTLTNEAVDAAMGKVIDAAQRQGFKLRQ